MLGGIEKGFAVWHKGLYIEVSKLDCFHNFHEEC